MKHSDKSFKGSRRSDMNEPHNAGQSVRQPIAPAPESISASASQLRGPQHGLPPQLMAHLGGPAPVFPGGTIVPNIGAMLPTPDAYLTGAMTDPVSFANADVYAAIGLPGTDPSVIQSNPYLTLAPNLAAQPPYADGFSRKRDRDVLSSSISEFGSNDRAKQNRDRNREHARSTRLRKKAYVAKLKDLVEGLHSQRTEDMRQRRVAIQHLSEVQSVRRNVVRTFLNYFCTFERDERKWITLIEEKFWLKEPVTPYRSFRRAEIEKDCHISKGLNSMMCNAASLSVMVESIGSRSTRWMQLKRQEITLVAMAQLGAKKVPTCLEKQPSRLHHAISSLSSNSEILSAEESTNGSEGKSEVVTVNHEPTSFKQKGQTESAAKVSSSSGSSNDGSDKKQESTNVYHDYNAKPLPDPKGDESESRGPSGHGSPEESGDSMKQADTAESSSGDDADAATDPPPSKKHKVRDSSDQSSGSTSRAIAAPKKSALGPPIAKKGGIPHNIAPVINSVSLSSGTDRLKTAPAVVLPPFTGLGKRSVKAVSSQSSATKGVAVVDAASVNGAGASAQSTDADSSSVSSDSNKMPRISADFHINEDDMIMMDSVLMCPFVFRSSDAVLCGAVSECVMPGMLRAQFSHRNKLVSLEMIYDSMGFMQQLERANGNEGAAQIVPGSLEMALTPTSTEARVITLAKAPYLIVNVNDLWTQTTGYTQMEVEGKPYATLLDGEATLAPSDANGRPPYDLAEVSKGRSACTTNIHYDKAGNDFIEFVCSYPLTNANDETTHLLHVSKELPSSHGTSPSQVYALP